MFLFYLIQPIKVKSIIYIPKGSLNYTIKKLQKSAVPILSIDKYILKFMGIPQSGWVDLGNTKNLTKFDFLKRLTTAKSAVKKIVLIPGETDYFIYKKIAQTMRFKNFNCSIPEGFLYPETYYLPYNFKKEEVCNYLYNVSLQKHKKISNQFFKNWDFNRYYKFLIIASIIQKETANKKEMKLVSSVIYNRLLKGMKLQMDGTLNYGKFSHQKVTPNRIKNDNTKFNTYKFKGLPLKPVCIVSKEAIVAAILPAKTDYLYFVRVVGNKHKFSKTYKEHLKNF